MQRITLHDIFFTISDKSVIPNSCVLNYSFTKHVAVNLKDFRPELQLPRAFGQNYPLKT